MALPSGFETEFRSGDPEMSPYTPSGAVAAGEVVVKANLTAIAHRAIAAGELGAVGVLGGVYRGDKTAGSGTAIPGGTKLYWDDSGNKPTTTASSNKVLGYATADGAADADTYVDFVHEPGF